MKRLLTTAVLLLAGATALSAQTAFVSGRVTAINGIALPNMRVEAWAPGAMKAAQTATTGIDGTYALNLPAATYRFLAYDPLGFFATDYHSEAGSFETSAEFTLAPSQSLTNVNFRLVQAVHVSGVVTASGILASDMTVAAYNLDGTRRAHEKTRSGGDFSITLPPGTYKFVAWDDLGFFAPSFYSGKTSFAAAETVTVSGERAGINFALSRGGKIRGRAVDASTGQPVSGIEIIAYEAQGGAMIAFAKTGSDGRVAFTVPAGSYKFAAADPDGRFATLFAGNAPTFASAPSFGVAAGSELAGLEFALSRPTDPPAPSVLYVPVAANTPGANQTHFLTDLWVYNPTAAAIDVGVDYFAFNGGAPRQNSVTVPARGQVDYANVLETLFQASGGGALRFTANGAFVVMSRTYNRPPNAAEAGTFGLAVPGMPLAATLGRAVLPGIIDNATARTNIGTFNPHDHPITIRHRLYDPAGTLVAESSRPLAAKGWEQPNARLQIFGLAGPIDRGYLVLDSADGSFFSFAAVVDQKSGDTTLILPAPDLDEE